MSRKPEPLFIIAGSLEQAIRYAQERGLSHGAWRYLSRVDRLDEAVQPRYAFVGTWRSREDRDAILQALHRVGGIEVKAPVEWAS